LITAIKQITHGGELIKFKKAVSLGNLFSFVYRYITKNA